MRTYRSDSSHPLGEENGDSDKEAVSYEHMEDRPALDVKTREFRVGELLSMKKELEKELHASAKADGASGSAKDGDATRTGGTPVVGPIPCPLERAES